MFRTKKDVERHVSDVLSKIDNENEKYLRGYTFARLFFQVKDYESAKKYLTGFLSVRDHHAASHKLMAQIYDANNNPESALQSYKRSLEIDPQQNDIVLKICELYCQLPVDHETARYWADRAEQLYPHHETVFKLREYLVTAEGEPDRQELENLIATELTAQPKNIDLRIKLLRLYLDTERVKEAYDHATMIESKRLFPNSVDWYYLLGDIFEAYQEESEEDQDSQFYINYLTALDHLIFLTLAEPHTFISESNKKSPSLNDAAAVLLMFDQLLKKAVQNKSDNKEGSWNYFIQYMKGQLYLHMTSLLMKRAKMDQGNRKEAFRFCSGLAVVCYTFKPTNLLQEVWFSQMEDNQKAFTSFFQQSTLRSSFIGHVLLSFCRNDKSSWLQKMKTEVCIPQVKERIYNRVFSSLSQKEKMSSSYFVTDSTFEQSSLELPTEVVLKESDKSAYKLCAGSLHHLVWLELHGEKMSDPSHDNIFEIFKNLQYSNKNLSKGSCESLCVLDFEAYLYATVYQSKFLMERRSNIMNAKSDSLLSYPPDIADSLCTNIQASWWRSAHGLYACTIKEKLGDHRRNLQHGLEVIRGIGNHGMEVQLIIHLAHAFSNKADTLDKISENKTDKNKNKLTIDNVTALYSRATHYWNIALGMLEKLSSDLTLNTPKDPMFTGSDRVLSKNEVKAYQEEGQLFLAVRLMDSDKLNDAAELLSKLSSPYGSYYLAQTLVKLASQESRYSSARISLLNKAKNSVHDTMDRIKDDSCHALNKELFVILEDIESDLGHETSIANENSCEDTDETDTYDGSSIRNNSFSWQNNSISAVHSTPRPSSKFIPSQRSIKSPSQEQRTQHFQPSPERLDAQIRALALNQDTLTKSFFEQQQTLLETNKSIVDALNKNREVVEQLKKQLEELSLTGLKYHPRTIPKRHVYVKGQGDEEEEYYDHNGMLDYYEEGGEDYRASGYNFDRASRMIHEAPPGASAQLNYVVSPALPPGPPPPLNHYNYQYPPHAVLPTPPPVVAERPQYYHPPPGQGLPFSEGQQLPQFHFHVASSVVKPPPPTLSTSLPAVMPGLPSVTVPPPSVMSPATAPLPAAAPWSKSVSVPHAFQIPLSTCSSGIAPTSSTIAQSSTAVSAPSHSLLKNLLQTPPGSKTITFGQPVTTHTAATSSPAIFSGFARSPEAYRSPEAKEKSKCDSENAASPDIDLEREVMGDFKPLIPLPAEIVVETGEENEVVLFEDRAKLYRFVEQEWKERGIGVVKILHDEGSSHVRLLMRRDQVLKVCANHYISSNMEIHPLKNSDKAWTWVAPDFADEELRPEHFCIRFKTPEIALGFKNAFEKAINISKDTDVIKVTSPKISTTVTTSPLSQKPFGGKFLPKAGSWTCPTCYVSNAGDKLLCVACETKKPGSGNQVSAAVTVTTSLNTESKSPFQPSTVSSNFTFGFPTTTSSTNSTVSTVTSSNSAKSIFGGFTFSSSPLIQEAEIPDLKDREILVVSTKSKDGPQVTKVTTPKASPFSGFSFQSPIISTAQPSSTANTSLFASLDTSTSQSNINTPTSGNISISNIQSSMQNISPAFVFTKNNINDAKSATSLSKTPESLVIHVSSDGRRVSTDGVEHAPEEFVPTAEFKPVVPLPALVDVKTGEEGEEKIFCERAKLFRFDSETKEWKERGTGEMKILYLKDSHKFRILMRRDQVLKLCANHYILPDMKLSPLNNSDRAWIWIAQDYSEGEMTQEKFAVKFKNKDIAQQFFKSFERCQKQLLIHNERESCESVNPCTGNKNAFEQLLQPTANSWRCPKCSKNNISRSCCVFCQTPYSENIEQISSTSSVDQKILDGFKAVDSTNQTSKSLSFGSITITPSNADKPLSMLFKPQVGSWECQSCYVRNNAETAKCASCETAKPGTTSSSNTTVTPVTVDKPLSELFRPQVGSWECESCYVRNNADVTKCASCETIKPGTSTMGLSKFQFDSSKTPNSTPVFGNVKSSEFVFGGKPAAPTTTFSFGLSGLSSNSNETPVPFKPATFGGVTQKTESSTSIFGGNPLKTDSSVSIFGGNGQKGNEFSSIFGVASQKPDSSTSIFGGSTTSIFGATNQKTDSSTPVFGGTTQKADSSASIFGEPVPAFGFAQKVLTEKNNSFGQLSQKFETKQENSQSVFSFGSTTPSNKDSTPSGFRFGSPQKYEFNFSGVRPRSPTKTPKSPRSPEAPSDIEDDDDESFDADNIYFQPVIPLPPKVDLKTGEENENTLFCKRAKLFRFCSGEWKERGIGDIKILYDESGKKIRLVMRRDQVLKVCLNHSLTRNIVFEKRNDKTLSWAVTDYSENEPSDEIFAVRFKTSEFADEFKTAIDDALKLIENQNSSVDVSKAAASFSFKTDPSPKTETSFSSGSLLSRFGASGDTSSTADTSKLFSFSFKDKPTSSTFFSSNNASSAFKFGQEPSTRKDDTPCDKDEIEVVFEAMPTSEEVTRAKELQLPPTFFLYKNKPPCPGCEGCEDYVPPIKTTIDPKCQENAETKNDTPDLNVAEGSECSLFNTKNAVGFADLTSNSGSTGFSSSSKKGFEGAGTPLFKLNNSTEGNEDDETVAEGPDIHFEPVIPLPELVDVKTGEEEEIPVFAQRAKLFKYDTSKKEWKERGIGEMKILRHTEKLRFRIILRREQVHKVACNHCIATEMELSPLNTSDTAVCWNALDFSEGQGEASQFAVRFKNKELLQEFKQKFNECRDVLKKARNQAPAQVHGTSILNQSAENTNTLLNPSAKPAVEYSDSTTESSADGHEQTNSESEDEEEEDSEDDSFIFEKRCKFEICEGSGNDFKSAGMGSLSISYDDSVYGYRVQMISDDSHYLCDHIIAIQTCLSMEGNKKATWAAIDLSVDPPRRRKFRAIFSSQDALKEFNTCFEEGKDAAIQSEIVEKTDCIYSSSDRQQT